MKATITFNLPEDYREFELAVKAQDIFMILWDLDQWLRQRIKYGHDFKTPDEALEKVREELLGSMLSKRVDLDMIE